MNTQRRTDKRKHHRMDRERDIHIESGGGGGEGTQETQKEIQRQTEKDRWKDKGVVVAGPSCSLPLAAIKKRGVCLDK